MKKDVNSKVTTTMFQIWEVYVPPLNGIIVNVNLSQSRRKTQLISKRSVLVSHKSFN